MIAELKGKISSNGSNLSERLEDKLTGDFFGALRYVPFNKVMKNILLGTKFVNQNSSYVVQCLDGLDIEYWDNSIQFWPYNSLGELDVLIELEEIVIGIEVKLYSGLSSDDSIDNSSNTFMLESNHQLARESRILKKKIEGTNKAALLIFIAPEYVCYPICKAADNRNIIDNDVILGYLSWEEILVTLEKIIQIKGLNNYEELMVRDLMALLKRKGLERFKSFNFICNKVSREWYQFNYQKSLDIDFSFNYDIKREGYYEFR